MKRREAIQRSSLIAAAAALSPSLLSLLQSCKKQDRISWEPKYFTDDEAMFVSTLVDTWLPKTATPGALEMHVDMFLDLVFDQMYDPAGKEDVRLQLSELMERCRNEFGNTLSALSVDDRHKFLRQLEAETEKFNPGVWGTAVGKQEPVGFYRVLKSMALWGYFTSEGIGKNVLRYDPIPTEFLGCIPLSDSEKIWSL